MFYENSFILAVHDQKSKYRFYWMQILGAAKRFANKYCYYQLDSLKTILQPWQVKHYTYK